MGYSLIIGEAININVDDLNLKVDVAEIIDMNSPAFGEPTDNTNSRWPSYTAWWDFCEFVGLRDKMFDETDNIHGGHPGYFLITEDFKNAVDFAHKRHMMRYKDAIAEYDTDRPQDYHLCRLVWLKYWTDWAFENCEIPIFKNT